MFVSPKSTFSLLFLRDQDNAIIRPLPKIKRMISDNACLPHIVQVKVYILWLFVLVFYSYFLSVPLFTASVLFFFPAAFDL